MKKVEKKRIDWIDTLRGLAMFFVVWGHNQKNGTLIRKYIYSFHMPMFFFISGLTFGEADKLPFKDFLKKKVKGLIIPYIVLNILCYIIRLIFYKTGIIASFDYIGYIGGVFYANNKILPIPAGPSWFLISLLLVDIIFYFLKRNTNSDFELGVSCFICALISYVNSLSKFQIRGPFHFEAVLMGVMFYYLGYLFIKNIKKFDFLLKDNTRMLFYGLALGSIGFVTAYVNRRVSMDANLYGSITLFFISSICTILGLVLFVNLFLKKSHFLKTIGQNTVFYLGYHSMLILVMKHFYIKLFNSNLYVLLIAIGMTIVLYPLSILVKKYCPILIGKINIKVLN